MFLSIQKDGKYQAFINIFFAANDILVDANKHFLSKPKALLAE